MKPKNQHWQAWIFDLDDTLLDTSGELIPSALQRACEYLVQEGALPSNEVGLEKLAKARGKKTGIALFKSILSGEDEVLKKRLAQTAYEVFRTPILPEKLTLLARGHEVLLRAQKEFPLFLLTQGDIQTQIQKVDRLGIRPFFRRIYYVDPFTGESKLDALHAILTHHQLSAERVLSIGNRLDNEIALSKRLGMTTCYLKYGEHQHESPSTSEEVPDYTINQLAELLPLLENKEPSR